MRTPRNPPRCPQPLALILLALLPVAVRAEPTAPDGGLLIFVPRGVYTTEISEPAESASLGDVHATMDSVRAALAEERLSDALRGAAWVLRTDPDNAEARRLLGYGRAGGGWGGGYAAKRHERGEVWSPRFGWVKQADLGRWEAGERRLGRRWVGAAEDARRHAQMKRGWVVRTDYFVVQTNHALQTAAELAARLERLRVIWEQLFAEFVYTPGELRERMDERRSTPYRSKPFEVYCYATRGEYVDALRADQPRIAQTEGIYFDRKRRSYFFAGKDQDAGTVRHEATHQLFHESERAARGVGVLQNSWAIEGVACYMESLRLVAEEPAGAVYSVGGVESGRMPAAVHRRLVDDYYVPLAELVGLGTAGLQKRPDLPRLYSQSAGLATFFLHGRGGAYREAFTQYLAWVYAGRDAPETLAELCGRRYDQLDTEYQEFLTRAARLAMGLDRPTAPPASQGAPR